MDLIGSNSDPPSVLVANADGTTFTVPIGLGTPRLYPIADPTNFNSDAEMLFDCEPLDTI